MTELSRAFALCAASDEAIAIRDDVGFFQAVKAALNKRTRRAKDARADRRRHPPACVAKAITTEGQMIDVFTAAGLQKPDIRHSVRPVPGRSARLKYKNVAAELLAKLLKDEIKVRSKRNLVQSREFSARC